MAKPNHELPVFTWFLVGALLFSVFTFLLGVWVCAHAPRAGETSTDMVPIVTETVPAEQGPDLGVSTSAVVDEPKTATGEPQVAAPLPKPVTEPSPIPSAQKKTVASKPSRATKKTPPTRVETRKTGTGKEQAITKRKKTYYIQLVATTDRKGAVKLKQRLEAQGYNVYLLTSRKRKHSLYRVRIGVFKDYRHARSIAAKIGKEYKLKPWIIAE